MDGVVINQKLTKRMWKEEECLQQKSLSAAVGLDTRWLSREADAFLAKDTPSLLTGICTQEETQEVREHSA